MQMPKSDPTTLQRFGAIAEDLVGRGATRGSMFGMPMLKDGTKMFAGVYGDAMTFKLGPEDLTAALETTGVEPFEPMPGRPMREWVLVPLRHSKRWAELAEQARRYVAG